MPYMEYNFEMTLTPTVVEMFKESILSYLELEIIQGEVTQLSDGLIQYRLNVDDEKGTIIKMIMVEMIKKQNYNAN